MRENITTSIKVIIIFLIVGTIINDASAFMVASFFAQDTADSVARSFATEYNATNSQTAANYNATITSNKNGVSLDGYSINPSEVEVTIRVPVNRTVYIGKIKYLKDILGVVKVTGTAPISQ